MKEGAVRQCCHTLIGAPRCVDQARFEVLGAHLAIVETVKALRGATKIGVAPSYVLCFHGWAGWAGWLPKMSVQCLCLLSAGLEL